MQFLTSDTGESDISENNNRPHFKKQTTLLFGRLEDIDIPIPLLSNVNLCIKITQAVEKLHGLTYLQQKADNDNASK
ncbi:31966_t:CDS:2 [Gigaspora margarita]|uniref:31966_t:CDS:1 n=1 Tax=Gigaspora margarita TaxID=4874 RepID=A0ABM8W3E7_GIGMA|nr:31966_t:CDS:2 [Gigaspora margarita]